MNTTDNAQKETPNERFLKVLNKRSSSRVGRFDSQKLKIILHSLQHEIKGADFQKQKEIKEI